jgi:uncharacterized protein
VSATAAPDTALPRLPALVVGRVMHQRRDPVKHAFRHRLYQWLVDLDSVPEHLSVLVGFDSSDHLGDPRLTIRDNIANYLALDGISLGANGRVVMLASARVLGHVFNPLSLFWCYDGCGRLAAVVAEVHNTYGERHAYVLHPDDTGFAVTRKAFYVSPFFDVSGSYELRFTLRPDRVSTSVALRRDGAVVFAAAFRGRPEPATRRAVARLQVRQPLMTQRVSTLIRLHGIWLWLRGLRVHSRQPHIRQLGV